MNTLYKTLSFALLALVSAPLVQAQTYYNANIQKVTSTGLINDKNMESFLVPIEKTTQIYSPDAILYVDITSDNVEGDIQEENPNMLRIKPNPDSFMNNDFFLVTIVTKNYVQTFKMVVSGVQNPNTVYTHLIAVDPNKGLLFDNDNDLNPSEFKRVATMALTKKRKINNIATSDYGMEMTVNNLYTLGDYILVDLTINNKSNIQYDVNDMRFRLEDLKQYKATVSQELEMNPLYTLYKDDNNVIKRKRSYRNVYVFKKFTYPTQKTFIIELTEKGISGRKIRTDINYNQLLKADYFL